MDIETRLLRIAHLAEQNEDRNLKFRTFLKGASISDEKLDAAVHALFAEISAQIDCTACANCCRALDTLFTKEELARIAAHLGTAEEELRQRHGIEWDADENAWHAGRPCPFLKGNLCSVYEVRPERCRSYPYLHRDRFRSRLLTVVANCSVCPIVHNVYERLKAQLWRRRR